MAGGAVSLTAETVSLGRGALAVGSAGQQGASGTLKVAATTLQAGSGRLVAGELLEVTAATIDIVRETDTETPNLLSLGAMVLDTERIDASNGRVVAGAGLRIQGNDGLTLNDGRYSAGTRLDVAAQRITSSAELRAVTDLTVEALTGTVINSGVVSGDGSTGVTAATEVENSGQILSQGEVAVTSGGATRNLTAGQMVGGGVTLTVGALDNAGQIRAQGGSLAIDVTGEQRHGERGERPDRCSAAPRLLMG